MKCSVLKNGTYRLKDTVSEHPTWSPDGKLIAFASDRGGNYQIYIMRKDGSGDPNYEWNREYVADMVLVL